MTDRPRAALKPTLGLLDATAIGVGAIIGAGIFVVTGIAATHAGSAVVVSMLIAEEGRPDSHAPGRGWRRG